jgi:hypothetical protein
MKFCRVRGEILSIAAASRTLTASLSPCTMGQDYAGTCATHIARAKLFRDGKN